MSVGKMISLSSIGASICMLLYFRGDLQRYMKMKRM